MALSVEHLNTYCEFGLPMSMGKGKREFVAKAAFEDSEGLKVMSDQTLSWWNLSFWAFKPVLLPISVVLEDEIVVNGRLIKEPYKILYPLSNGGKLPIVSPEKLPHDKFRLLASWGVDLYNLIPRNEAFNKLEFQ